MVFTPAIETRDLSKRPRLVDAIPTTVSGDPFLTKVANSISVIVVVVTLTVPIPGLETLATFAVAPKFLVISLSKTTLSPEVYPVPPVSIPIASIVPFLAKLIVES